MWWIKPEAIPHTASAASLPAHWPCSRHLLQASRLSLPPPFSHTSFSAWQNLPQSCHLTPLAWLAVPSMSIMWLHLDYNYLCNKREIYLLELGVGWGWGPACQGYFHAQWASAGAWLPLPGSTAFGERLTVKVRHDKKQKVMSMRFLKCLEH